MGHAPTLTEGRAASTPDRLRPLDRTYFSPIPGSPPSPPGPTMLNYIWAGLIVTSFLFALGYDARDIAGDRYRNGRPLPVALAFTEVYDSAARRVPVEIRIDPLQYTTFYETEEKPAASYPGYLLQTREGRQLRFEAGAKLPEPLATIAKVSSSRDQELQGRLDGFSPLAAAQAPDTAFPVAAGSSSSRSGSSSSTPSPPRHSTSPRPPRGSRSGWSACWPSSSACSRSPRMPGSCTPWSSWSGPSFARSFPRSRPTIPRSA